MIPTRAVREQAMILLAANAATLAPAADANAIALIKAAFTPGEDLAIGDLTLADFDGSTPIEGATGAQAESLDPGTLDSIIDILEPAGGYRWETTGLTNLPQTIFGYCLVSNDLATLLASATFADPIVLTIVNQSIVVDRPNLRQLAGSIQ